MPRLSWILCAQRGGGGVRSKYDSLDGLRIAGWYCLPRERNTFPPVFSIQVTSVSRPCQNHTLPKAMRPLGLRHVANYAAMAHSILDIGLLTNNINDRDNYGYKGFYIDAVRVIDFLLEQPEVDSERIGIQGSSQGGAPTLVIRTPSASRAASAGAPYLAGVLDAFKLTRTYRMRKSTIIWEFTQNKVPL